MVFIENHGTFPAELLSVPDADAQERLVLVIKTTWIQSARPGILEPAPEQPPLQLADVHVADPATSSVRYEGENAAEKPRIDVLVNATAYTPHGRPASEVTVELQGGGMHKRVRVVGDRFRTLTGESAPEPFVSMPIIYERAYGGVDRRDTDPSRHKTWKPNPVGIGFGRSRPSLPEIRTEYPNLEDPDGGRREAPAGFGVIARHWSPRLEWAGTYDQQWLASQWPLLPHDFDARHYLAAPADQQVDVLRTGEPFQTTNLTPEGTWSFALPPTESEAWLMFDTGRRRAHPRMDTVLIEPDAKTVSLIFRLTLPQSRGRDRLREIVLGPVSSARLLAIERRKPYVHPRELGAFRHV